MRSLILEMTGVRDIGLYSDETVELTTFRIYTMDACFHCLGTTDVQMESETESMPVKRRQSSVTMRESGPIQRHRRNWSNILNIRYSVM